MADSIKEVEMVNPDQKEANVERPTLNSEFGRGTHVRVADLCDASHSSAPRTRRRGETALRVSGSQKTVAALSWVPNVGALRPTRPPLQRGVHARPRSALAATVRSFSSSRLFWNLGRRTYAPASSIRFCAGETLDLTAAGGRGRSQEIHRRRMSFIWGRRTVVVLNRSITVGRGNRFLMISRRRRLARLRSRHQIQTSFTPRVGEDCI